MELPRWSEERRLPALPARIREAIAVEAPPSLAQQDLVRFVLATTGGLTGAVAQLLTLAVEITIRDGSERICLAHLEVVAQLTP